MFGNYVGADADARVDAVDAEPDLGWRRVDFGPAARRDVLRAG